ncbi:MAG TPA: hypothetical protein VF377_06880 [Acidimicrobiia bacterium]
MADLATLCDQTLDVLYGTGYWEHPKEDTLSAAIADASTTTMTPATPSMWKRDYLCEFPATDEVVRIADDAVTTATIRRGQLGTTAAAQALGAVMVQNPPFPRIKVKDEIERALRNEFWPHVWTWHRDSFTFTQGTATYELDDHIDDVTVVYQANIESDGQFHPLHPGWWDVERQIDDATNKRWLIVHKVYDPDSDVEIIARRRPHPDDLANISDEIADMVPLITAARMMQKRGASIRQSQPRSQLDRDGQMMRDYRAMVAEFIRQRDQLHRLLMEEVRPDMRWRPATRAFRRSW